jgi:GTP cyclohydrolase I
MTSDDTTLSEPTTDSAPGALEEGFDHQKARKGARLLLEVIGEDPDHGHLEATWRRRVPEFLEEFTEGQREQNKPTMRTFSAESGGLVIKTGIPVYSLCEHHLLPFHGTAHLAYRPGDEVVGLSKLVRYVRWQARQLTMQERLTNDIADGLATELDADVVFVELEAIHMCEAMRGVETETETVTRRVVGTPSSAERDRFNVAVNRSHR